MRYNTITKNQDYLLRGAAQQQTTRAARRLLYEGPSPYPQRGHLTGALTGVTATPSEATVSIAPAGLELGRWQIRNGSGSEQIVGIGFRHRNDIWRMYDYDDNSGAPTITHVPTYQSRTATTFFATIGVPADEDGVLIASAYPFNWISMNVTTASINAGASDADIDYWGSAGAWVTATSGNALVDGLTLVAGELGVGERILAIPAWDDWTPTQANDLLTNAGVPVGWYALLYRWSDVPTTDPAVTGVEIGSMVFSHTLSDNETWNPDLAPFTDLNGDGVVALMSAAAAGNHVTFDVIARG